MPEYGAVVQRVVAKVRALLVTDWLGTAGERFQQTTTAISDYAKEHEVVDTAIDLGVKAVKGKAELEYSESLVNYSEEERIKTETELKRRTMTSTERLSEAAARKAESEARLAELNEMERRLAFFDQLRERKAIPYWSDNGRMTFVRAPKDFDWDSLQDHILSTGEMPELKELARPSAEESSPPPANSYDEPTIVDEQHARREPSEPNVPRERTPPDAGESVSALRARSHKRS